MCILEGTVIVIEIAYEFNDITLFKFRHRLSDNIDLFLFAVIRRDPGHISALVRIIEYDHQVGKLSVDQARHDPRDRIIGAVVERIGVVIRDRLFVDGDPVFSLVRDQVALLVELIDIIFAQIRVSLARIDECVELQIRDHLPLILGKLDLLLAVFLDPSQLRDIKMRILDVLHRIFL